MISDRFININKLNELNKDRNNVFSNTDPDYDTNNGNNNNNNINNNINHNSNNVATTTRDYTKQPQSHNSNLPTTKQKNVKNKQELIRNICFNVCLSCRLKVTNHILLIVHSIKSQNHNDITLYLSRSSKLTTAI
ncbi:hypothetical protein HELRODRAFT_159206 [Helobdella robusta]|uniref:Uncharacterized protein n=1 Tax=Helobdella robusta TaxID=6412 RepID=T1ENQ9_HELRO|nr:hypothetical protein HELRODRAFT_159206 [Helobdella robusta]ESO12633.1 hypothetical protein HELRODRAFT_159206 [Helobdella robusta]